jgi:hypothetical protein
MRPNAHPFWQALCGDVTAGWLPVRLVPFHAEDNFRHHILYTRPSKRVYSRCKPL